MKVLISDNFSDSSHALIWIYLYTWLIHAGGLKYYGMEPIVIREAIKAKEEGKKKVILFNWSGHGLVDMAAYEAYLSGKLKDHDFPQEEIERALRDIETLPKPKQAQG